MVSQPQIKRLPDDWVIQDDDPCFFLSEVNLNAPDSRGFHRYEILILLYNYELAEYRRNLGAEIMFSAEQIRIPGGEIMPDGRIEVWETVGRLRDAANEWRTRPPASLQIEPSPMIEMYHDAMDKKRSLQQGSNLDVIDAVNEFLKKEREGK